MQFFFEVLIGGLLSGVMYSLVALGFVLIYKASGVFNFAQGAMVFFAALTFVSLVERGWNMWLALVVTLAVMVVLGLVTERVVLRPLVNQPQITLFMATSVTRSASHPFQPRSTSDTYVSAAKNTMVPWAKLKTPDAL